MVDVIEYMVEKFKIDLSKPSPFWIPVNRWTDYPQILKELEVKSGAEIGVLDGLYSEVLSRELPDAKIYSIDKWEWYPVRNNFRKQHNYPPIYERAKARLSQYPNNEIVREWSVDAVRFFEDNSLDFVWIDADHRFEFVTVDIAAWSRKVKVGGIVSGHDYGRGNTNATFCHVPWVVDAWTLSHGIHPWFVLDFKPEWSWMFVKQKDGSMHRIEQIESLREEQLRQKRG